MRHPFLGQGQITCVVHVNTAAVLGAHVIALAIERGRVMHREEHLEQLRQAHLFIVITKLHHLNVPGVAIADLLVTGLVHMAIAIRRLDIGHAFDTHKHCFGAPKAATAQSDGALAHAAPWMCSRTACPKRPMPSSILASSAVAKLKRRLLVSG